MRKILRVVATCACCLLFSLPARAVPIGSTLREAPNANYGCDQALILDPIFGVPTVVPTGQTTCTIRNFGYFGNVTRLGSYVPASGFITQVRVRTANAPAPFRLTIMQGSPGLCCTTKSFSRVFRPRANRINAFNVMMRVIRSAHRTPTGGGVAQVTDLVAYTAVGPGTLPLLYKGTAGTYAPGSALSQFWFPFAQTGVPRNLDVLTIDGIELMMQANWVKAGDPILRERK